MQVGFAILVVVVVVIDDDGLLCFVVCRLLLLSAILCQCISEKLQLAVGFFKYILYSYKLII